MTASAIDILRAYLDINDISPKEHILEAGALLVERPETIVINYAKKWYILMYFQKYLQGTLNIEKFMGVGDGESTLTIFEQKVYLKWWASAREDLHKLAEAHWSVRQWVLVLLDQIWVEYMQTREPDQWEAFGEEVRAQHGKIVVLDTFLYDAPADEPVPYGTW